MFLGGTPPSQGPSFPQFLRPYRHPIGLTESDEFWYDDVRWGSIACFYGSSTLHSQGIGGPASPKCFEPLPSPKRSDREWRNLVYDNTWGSSVQLLGGRYAPIPGRPGPSDSEIFGTSNLHPNGLNHSDEIWYDNTCWRINVFPGVFYAPISRDGAPASPKLWDLLHTQAQNEKQQPNFVWWSNYTWGKFLHGRAWMLTREFTIYF